MDTPRKDDSLVRILYLLLMVLGLVPIGFGAYCYRKGIQVEINSILLFLAAGVLLTMIPVALMPIAMSLRRMASGEADAAQQETVQLLRAISAKLDTSDIGKRIAQRQQDRDSLRKAIKEDIDKGDAEGAMALVVEMSQVYKHESEALREKILEIRAADMERKINEGMHIFQAYISESNWEKASGEASKLTRLYPDVERVRDLSRRLREAKENRKHDLERRFLEAAQRDDVEKAMELLTEMDKYLSQSEAEPFREMARGVIGKKRQNLGVQFKMAVHDKEWTTAVRIGEQIIREFPNSKMADEVRGLLDVLRARAAGEQAARSREVAAK